MNAGRPPTPDDMRLYRIELLEQGLAQLRMELREEYLDRAQLMNEYMPRAEHLRRQEERRQWPLVLATVAMALTSVANLAVLIGHA